MRERISQIQMHVLARRRRRQGLPILFREIGFENVLGDRGGIGAVNAVFEEDHARDFRIVAWREERKPSVIAKVLRRSGRGASLIRDHLRGAGLSAHVLALYPRAS